MLSRLLRRLTRRRDYLDGIRDGVLHGWALPRPGNGPVPVALYSGQTRLAETLASQFRDDLRDQLAAVWDIPRDNIIINPCTIGGDFGGKGSYMDVPLCYYLALHSGRPEWSVGCGGSASER